MKKWYKSKTIWLNLIAAAIALLGIFDEALLSLLGITNTSKFLAIIGALTTALNILMRVLTSKIIYTSTNNNK